MNVSASHEPRRTHWHDAPLTSVCNDTKWERLRTSMLALSRRPQFRTMDLNGFYAPADGEWNYHFRLGGYTTTRYVDLLCPDDEMAGQVLDVLRSSHVSGHPIDGGYRVYGYVQPGDEISKSEGPP